MAIASLKSVGESTAAFVIRAVEFAFNKHLARHRENTPAFHSLLAVARLLSTEIGITDRVILASALLQDTIEHTDTTAGELDSVFGKKVAETVLEVHGGGLLVETARKARRVSVKGSTVHNARLIRLANIICKLRDRGSGQLSAELRQCGRGKLDHSMRDVEELRGTNSQLEALFDSEYLKRP